MKEGYACHSIMRFPIFMSHTSVMLVTKETGFSRLCGKVIDGSNSIVRIKKKKQLPTWSYKDGECLSKHVQGRGYQVDC